MPSRQARNIRKLIADGVCPQCGKRPLADDPRFRRDIEIRVLLHQGESVADVAKHFSLTPRMVNRIRKQPAGKPKLLSRCEVCTRKRQNYSIRIADLNAGAPNPQSAA